jgi:hypothetical protein
MKTIKLLFIFLVLFSFQAEATGYVHNMFVAHRKLQACKEVVSEKVIVKKSKATLKLSKPAAHAKNSSFFNTSLAKTSESATLNERILEEGPASFFENEKNEDADDSVVTKLIGVFRNMIYAFIPALSKS